MKERHKKTSSRLFIFPLAFFCVAGVYGTLSHLTYAASGDYTPLAPLPDTLDGETTSLQTYLPGIFKLAIGIAGVLAVIEIIVGGLQYMSTDAIGGKSEGRTRITNAITGLLLALGAYLIMNTISPNFVTLNLDIKTAEVETTAPPGPEPATHLACVDSACAVVPGPGVSDCSACSSVTSHFACNAARQCVSVPGPGADDCVLCQGRTEVYQCVETDQVFGSLPECRAGCFRAPSISGTCMPVPP